MRPFRLKNFSLISAIKRIWIRFTCVSLFHYKISLLFFRFFSLIFASNFLLPFTLVIFASKRNKAKQNSSLFFRFFSLFFTFFRLFCFFLLFCRRCSNLDEYNFLLCFQNFCFGVRETLKGEGFFQCNSHLQTLVALFERVTCHLLFQL